MVRQQAQFQAGFTLVELLVTTGIIVLILAAVSISGGQTNAGRRLETAAESIRQGLYRTRSLALAPAADKSPAAIGYCFSLSGPTGGPYTGFRISEAAALTGSCSATEPTIDQELFPPDVTVTVSGDGNPGIIYAIDGYARITQPDPQATASLSVQLSQPQVKNPISVQLATGTGQVELCQAGVCQ